MDNEKKPVSIKDISRLSGVSVATVSRILNGTGRYSRETEKLVYRIVEEQQYVPNKAAKNLRTNCTQAIGIIVPDISNEFYARIVWEIEHVLFGLSYTTLVCNTNEEPEKERRCFSLMAGRVVDGILCATCLPADEPSFAMPGTPTVYIDRHPLLLDPQTSYIASDHRHGAYLATRAMLEQGRRQIALIIDERGISTKLERMAGYLQALTEYGLALDEELVIYLPVMGYQDAYDQTLAMMRRRPEIDGIFASTDWVALGASHALEALGRRCPEEVSLIGFDDISISLFCQKPITTIRQERNVVARLAVENLLSLIRGTPPQRPREVVPVRLIRRQTT